MQRAAQVESSAQPAPPALQRRSRGCRRSVWNGAARRLSAHHVVNGLPGLAGQKSAAHRARHGKDESESARKSTQRQRRGRPPSGGPSCPAVSECPLQPDQSQARALGAPSTRGIRTDPRGHDAWRAARGPTIPAPPRAGPTIPAPPRARSREFRSQGS